MTTRRSGLLPQIIFAKTVGSHKCYLRAGPLAGPFLYYFPPLLIRIWVEIKDQEAFGPPPEAEF